MTKNFKAHIAVFGANLIYGANYSIAKEIMPAYIQPFGFILIRVFVGTLLFFAAGFFINEKIDKKDFFRIFGCGLFGVAINQLMFFAGLAATSSINAALIMTTNPIMVLQMAHLIIRERISALKISGIFTGLTGAVLLILIKPVSAMQEATIKGDMFILINSFSFAVFLVIIKPLMHKYSPVTIMKWVFLFGFLMVTPFGYDEVLNAHWSTMNFPIWLGVIYVVVGTTFIAYLLNIFALKQLSPSVVSFYIYLQPVFAALFSILSAKENPKPLHFISAALIFTGVYLVSRTEKIKKINGLEN
jgi:drug/metabolite transporter (DMT)-like permease